MAKFMIIFEDAAGGVKISRESVPPCPDGDSPRVDAAFRKAFKKSAAMQAGVALFLKLSEDDDAD